MNCYSAPEEPCKAGREEGRREKEREKMENEILLRHNRSSFVIVVKFVMKRKKKAARAVFIASSDS